MTIQERCAVVDSLLTTLETTKQQQTLSEALNKRISDLGEVDTSFHTVMLSLKTLREGSILSASRLPDSSKVTERVASMRQQLAGAPEDVTKGQSFNLLCRAIRSLTEQCDAVATASWSEYVKNQAPVVDRTLLDQHRDSPRHADTVIEIERLAQDLKSALRKPPQDSPTLEVMRQRWARIAQLLGTMPVTDDPEVQAFLNSAVSSAGAALALFTPSVKQWLEENSMISDFCIRRSK